MNRTLSLRRFTLGLALGAIAAAALLVAAAYGGTASVQRAPKGALVALRKTTLARCSLTLAVAPCTCSRKTAKG